MQRTHAIGFQILLGAVVLISVGVVGWYLGGHGGLQKVTAAPSMHDPAMQKPVVNIDRARGLELARAAHAMLDDKLADYPSARFKDVYEVHYYLGTASYLVQNTKRRTSDLDSYILCGLMNAKNHFGAYTGWVPLMVGTGSVHIASQGDSLRESAIIASYCEGKGDGADGAIRSINAENIILAAEEKFRDLSALQTGTSSGPTDNERLTQQRKEEDESKLRQNLFPILPHTTDRSDGYARAISWSPQTATRAAK